MAALRDEWQAARLVRQQEMAQRREGIQAKLSHYQQVREQNTADLLQMLSEHYASVQDETNLYLTQVQQQRQAQAKRTAAMLQAFDAKLRATVAHLREDNRREMEVVAQSVLELREMTQELLAGHQRDRAVMRSRQQQMLTEYIDELEAAVADYLIEIAENRQAMAVADQAQRHRDREALMDDVQAMRDEFAIYRQQMQAFRENLRQSVWGDAVPQGPPAKVVPPTAKPASQPTKASNNGHKTSAPTRRTRAKAKPASAAPQSQPAPTPPAITQPEVPTEEAVFDYLQSHSDGARLTEIESTLGINRFQAVDALRSLIQKELIVQKDRTYRIQEEAVL